MADKIKIPSGGNEEEAKEKKPPRLVKSLTIKEFEMNSTYYSSEEYQNARKEYWTDEKGKEIYNPYQLK